MSSKSVRDRFEISSKSVRNPVRKRPRTSERILNQKWRSHTSGLLWGGQKEPSLLPRLPGNPPRHRNGTTTWTYRPQFQHPPRNASIAKKQNATRLTQKGRHSDYQTALNASHTMHTATFFPLPTTQDILPYPTPAARLPESLAIAWRETNLPMNTAIMALVVLWGEK